MPMKRHCRILHVSVPAERETENFSGQQYMLFFEGGKYLGEG
jgi:hypothetical protein